MPLKYPEKYRLKHGRMASSEGSPGAFKISVNGKQKGHLQVIASHELGWDHVSVVFVYGKQSKEQCPDWNQMCLVKDLFWEPEDLVVQYHPPEYEYINNYPYCLHLWRSQVEPIPAPPSYLVGVKGLAAIQPLGS